MLSKAPPVPQLSASNDSEEKPADRDGETPARSQDADAATNDGLPDAATGDRITEEVHEIPANVDPNPTAIRAPPEVSASRSSHRTLPRPETRVQKPADDRLFTLAAVGLTIAIAVLLFKKFMKSSGFGAVFMDGS